MAVQVEKDMMSMPKIKNDIKCMIKLGGSAITHKDKFETMNIEALQSTVKQIQKLYTDISNRFIIIHGAGSFGHFQANQYKVAKGNIINNFEVKMGFSETRLSVLKLNHKVVESLVKEGIPAIGLSPCSFMKCYNRKIVGNDLGTLLDVLKIGLVPVIHGDCVIDDNLECTILSGDVIIKKLAEIFKPSYVVFLTDVDGIYDKAPDEPNAKLISKINVSDNDEENKKILGNLDFTLKNHDTTGGMRKKVEESIEMVMSSDVDIIIAKINTQSSANVILNGKMGILYDSQECKGTLVTKY